MVTRRAMVVSGLILSLLALLLLQALLPLPERAKANNKVAQRVMFGSAKRPLKFAGTWYDANSKRLAEQIDSYISLAEPEVERLLPAGENVLAIIAPHAGYMYSGRTAAVSYLAASRAKVKRVFLLGPSHYQSFHGVALPSSDSFATVFGDLPLDKDVVADLSHSILFQTRADVHAQEHSLELQLAFIRKVLGKVKIVPLLLGRIEDEGEAAFVGGKIGEHLQDGDLIVVSSDFTHFGPRYDYMPFQNNFPARVKELDMEAFSHLAKADLGGFFSFYKRTDDTICGVYAIAAMLAMLPPESKGQLLDYRTSREHVAEDDLNSVSYLSCAFTNKMSWSQAMQARRQTLAAPLTAEERKSLLHLARHTLDVFVRTGHSPEVDIALSEKLLSPHGAFVTLQKKEGDKRELRGCIGYILPIKPLYQAVMDNAVGAASRDFRFAAVQPEELSSLHIDINVLTPPVRVASYKDIRLGVDGILLTAAGRQAVFLPSVAGEYGWTLEETLEQLALKAGLPANDWKSASFEVFQSQEFAEDEQ